VWLAGPALRARSAGKPPSRSRAKAADTVPSGRLTSAQVVRVFLMRRGPPQTGVHGRGRRGSSSGPTSPSMGPWPQFGCGSRRRLPNVVMPLDHHVAQRSCIDRVLVDLVSLLPIPSQRTVETAAHTAGLRGQTPARMRPVRGRGAGRAGAFEADTGGGYQPAERLAEARRWGPSSRGAAGGRGPAGLD